MRHMNCRTAGFTLVEILIVVVILGIAGAMIVPQISSRDDLKTSAAARLVMADLIYVQNLAITRQKCHYVIFDLTNRCYTVVESPTLSTVTNPISQNPYVVRFGAGGTSGLETTRLMSANFVGQSGTTFQIIGFDELGTPLAYSGSGSPETMSTGAIVLQTGSHHLEIDIEPFTGLISIK